MPTLFPGCKGASAAELHVSICAACFLSFSLGLRLFSAGDFPLEIKRLRVVADCLFFSHFLSSIERCRIVGRRAV